MSFKNHRDYKLGTLLIRRDRYLDATDKFKHLLDIFPNALPDILTFLYKQLKEKYFNLQLRILIAELYIYKEMYTDALEELEECTDLDPEHSNTYVVLGKMFRNNHLKEEIITIFETIISNHIFDSTIIDILPNYYLSEKSNKKSIHFFTLLCEQFPDNCSYLKTLASLYSQMRNYEEAAKIYETIAQKFNDHQEEIADRCEKLIRFCPDNKSIRKILISLHIKAVNLEQAYQHIDYLVDRDNSFYAQADALYKELLKLAPRTLFLLKGYAKLLINKNEYSKAVHFLADVITIDHNESEVVKQLLEKVLIKEPTQLLALELKLDIAIIQREFNHAISLIENLLNCDHVKEFSVLEKCDLIIEKHTDYQQQCIYLKSMYYYKTNHIENCLQLLQSITVSDWEEKKTLLQAQALEKKGKYKEAKTHLSNLIKNDPNNATLHHALQKTYTGLLNELEDLNHDTHDESHFFKTGLIYLRKGEFINAIEQFQKVSEDKHLLFQANTLISRCFFEMGRFDLAKNHINRSLDNCEAYSDTITKNKLLYFRAIINIHSGKFEHARETLDQLYTNDIRFPNIENILSFIRKQNHYEDHLFLTYYSTTNNNDIPIAMPLSNYTQPPSYSFGHQHNKKGVDYILKQHLLAAEEEFNLALQLDPSLSCVYGNLIIVYLMKNQVQDAKNTLIKLEEIPDLDEAIYIYKSLIFLKENNDKQAENTLKECIKAFPKCYIAHLYLGDLFWQNKHIESSFYHWEKANKLGLYFHLVNRRLHYLEDKAFTFTYWITDSTESPLNAIKNKSSELENHTQQPPLVEQHTPSMSTESKKADYQTSLLHPSEVPVETKKEKHIWGIEL